KSGKAEKRKSGKAEKRKSGKAERRKGGKAEKGKGKRVERRTSGKRPTIFCSSVSDAYSHNDYRGDTRGTSPRSESVRSPQARRSARPVDALGRRPARVRHPTRHHRPHPWRDGARGRKPLPHHPPTRDRRADRRSIWILALDRRATSL